MTVVPLTTPAPKPRAIFMPGTSTAASGTGGPGAASSSSSRPGPTSTAVPPGTATAGEQAPKSDMTDGKDDGAAFPQPKLRLEIRDLAHPGATRFLGSVNAAAVLSAAVAHVQHILYRRPSDPATHVPPTRSVTVVLRDMDGVAYTTGSELDGDHKEIHVSLPYVAGLAAERAAREITGVLTHELVHCYQWDAQGSCPGGLIEGVADWVRLRCGLSPPHWRRATDGRWDGGYERTAYFLDYLEGRFGEGTVRRLNEALRLHRYQEEAFWTGLLGRPVEQLWQDYVDTVQGARGAAVVDGATQT